jgi:hypothetical protein
MSCMHRQDDGRAGHSKFGAILRSVTTHYEHSEYSMKNLGIRSCNATIGRESFTIVLHSLI